MYLAANKMRGFFASLRMTIHSYFVITVKRI